MFRYGTALTYTTSLQQKCVSLSSREAEYVALSEGLKVISRLRQVSSKFNIVLVGTKAFQDSKSAINWENSGRAIHVQGVNMWIIGSTV